MIGTLVVDDDFRVADVHAGYVKSVTGFTVVGVAQSAAQTLRAVQDRRPDLVLLDLYLPDEHGLDVMRRLDEVPTPPDVIVVSAARDLASVRRAMRQGAVGYVAKPFGFALLNERLCAYRDLRRRVAALSTEGSQAAEQSDIDALFALLGGSTVAPAPKGQSESTMRLVREAVRHAAPDISAVQVADSVGISRTTAQRYLVYLARHGVIELRLQYGSTGRPEHRYRPRQG
ncbi:MAG: two-component system response regulator [Actinobacteria bacterium 69-20]|jgi:response regulator of citrate/malate metabolism|nr:response regulator [Actinomycetota bacterium]OJV25796.1 MAG: two-component system response regulator [Actinobacteria bacterium 69-20]